MKTAFGMALKFIFVGMVLSLVMSMAPRDTMDNRKIVPLLGKQGPFGEEKANQKIIPRTDQTSGFVGSLSIYMMRDPTFHSFSHGISGEDRYLDLWIKGPEWGALFLKVLKCPDVSEIPHLPDEGDDKWERRYALNFKQTIPSLPMLGRMWDLFIYVSFRPEEIEELRAECLKVQASTSDEKALSALNKVLNACDEASKHGSGLLFVPD